MFAISNDGWWGDTPGYKGLLNISRLRAIETRRPIVRSANTGISALIDQRGEVQDALLWNERGVISGSVYRSTKLTPYLRYGDLIVRLSLYTMTLTLLYILSLKYRRKRGF